MEETQQFLIMIDAPNKREAIIDFLVEYFNDAVRLKSNSCDLKGNWIEVWRNENADPESTQDEQTGYLHYRFRLEATPVNKEVAETDQVELAKEITACLEKHGCRCVICANFEHLL